MTWLFVLSKVLTFSSGVGIALAFYGALRLYLLASSAVDGQGSDLERMRQDAIRPLRLIVLGLGLEAISPLYTLWCVIIGPFPV